MGLDWLGERVAAIEALRPVELEAIRDFTLLWSLFESRVLQNNANPPRLVGVVEAWNRSGALADDPFSKTFAYFQERYFAGGAPTEHYVGLNLRKTDREAELRAVLDGSDASIRGRTLAVFLIVYRYRNNLFHGAKWDYGLADQFDNFTQANAALVIALDRFGEL
ncbi:hypothetical protein D3C71_1186090 [compost metagenome]